MTAAPTDRCCDHAYLCDGELECAVHGGFDVCCERPDLHLRMTAAPTGPEPRTDAAVGR